MKKPIIIFSISISVIFFCFLSLTSYLLPPNSSVLFSQSLVPTSHQSLVASRSAIIYGYLPYWTRSKARFPKELTHISYFSLGIQSDGRLLDLPKNQQESGLRAYKAGVLDNLRKEILPDQKLELTLTMMDQETIPVFLRNPDAIERCVNDIETILNTSPISGINIDIEYNGLVDDTLQEHFEEFLKRTAEVLKKRTPPRSLSVATYADAGSMTRITDLKRIEPYVDHVIMMAYDYHRRLSPKSGPNSPLYGKSLGMWESDIMGDLKGYTDAVPPEKILLGIPLYGYQWQVEDPSNPNSFTIPKSGATVTYEHILSLLQDSTVRRLFDPIAFSPYLSFEKNEKPYVLYYEDPESIRAKLSVVKNAGLGGIALWALGYEGGDLTIWETIHSSLSAP